MLAIVMLAGCSPADRGSGTKLSAERDLIVFVGRRLSVVEQPIEETAFDQKFEARYRVLQLVFRPLPRRGDHLHGL
jgi:hypothetical protein